MFMNLLTKIVLALLSLWLTSVGVYLAVDASLVAALGHEPLSHGSHEAWQLGLTGFMLSATGGSVASAASTLYQGSDAA